MGMQNLLRKDWFSFSPHRILYDLYQYRELIYAFTRRDFLSSYRGTYLGLAWSVISPIIMLLMFTAVFGGIFHGRFSSDPNETAVDFALALFIGLILFSFFSQILGGASGLISSNSIYVKGVDFPAQILPVTAVLHAALNMVISIFVCLFGFLVIKGFLHLTVIFIFLHVIVLLILGLGVSWFVSALGVFFRDLSSVIPPFTIVLMFWSLVFFPITSIPGAVRWSVQINPLAIIIEQARGCLMYGSMPDFKLLFIVFLVATATAVFGYWFFQRLKDAFTDVI